MATATSGATRGGSLARGGVWRLLSLGAVVGPALFTLAWLALGFVSRGYTLFGTRIAPYSPISQPISGLGLGETGPAMNAAFVACGLLTAAGMAGIFGGVREIGPRARLACGALLALSGVGQAICGVFTLEAMMPHLLGFLLACGAPAAGFLAAGLALRRAPRWQRLARWLLAASPLTLALLALFFATFTPTVAGTSAGVAGLVQRALVLEIHAWFIAMGLVALRSPA